MAYTSIDDPSAHFQTATYTGNGSNGHAITNNGNSNLQPDWIWFKNRSTAQSHILQDSTRGVTKYLISNSSGAEGTDSTLIASFDSDGFTVNSANNVNNNNDLQVAWQWKANGGTTSSNTDGSITSTVQANTDAGFSIVTYTGSGSDGSTVGHGLGAVPAMVIFKCRSDSNTDWRIYHQSISPTNAVSLNSTGAQYGASSVFTSAFSSTQLKLENEAGANGSSKTYVAYCFAEKQGYSKFGTYTGTNNNGTFSPFVWCGFKPAFVMTKASSSTSSWMMYDHKRLGYNTIDVALRANGADSESTSLISGDDIDLLSNGFKLRTDNATLNGDGVQYIFMAFAENPFVTSNTGGSIPVTAR